jgi:hypothetical protein
MGLRARAKQQLHLVIDQLSVGIRAMTELENQWHRGYIDRWNEQGVASTTEPTIPAVPNVPDGIANPEEWIYEQGKTRGELDRMKKQAGID